MKNLLKTATIFILTIGIFSTIGNSQELSRKEKRMAKQEAEYQNIKTLVDSGYFTIKIRNAQPSKGRNVDLSTYGADVKFDGTKVTSYMPYYGDTHSPTLGNRSGINFEQEVENFEVKFDDNKKQALISFTANANNEKYEFRITISGSESARVSVNLSKSTPISYFGIITKNETKVDK